MVAGSSTYRCRYAEPGEYEVLVGASCVDIRLRAHLTLTGPARSEVGGAAVEAGYRTLTLTRTLALSLTLTLALIPTIIPTIIPTLAGGLSHPRRRDACQARPRGAAGRGAST